MPQYLHTLHDANTYFTYLCSQPELVRAASGEPRCKWSQPGRLCHVNMHWRFFCNTQHVLFTPLWAFFSPLMLHSVECFKLWWLIKKYVKDRDVRWARCYGGNGGKWSEGSKKFVEAFWQGDRPPSVTNSMEESYSDCIPGPSQIQQLDVCFRRLQGTEGDDFWCTRDPSALPCSRMYPKSPILPYLLNDWPNNKLMTGLQMNEKLMRSDGGHQRLWLYIQCSQLLACV